MKENKEIYEAPQVESICFSLEGVLCQSPQTEQIEEGPFGGGY